MPPTVEAIFTAPAAGVPMVARDQVEAIPGQGLAGDRYRNKTGHWSGMQRPVMEATFIEAEVIESVAAELGISLEPAELRRNFVTRGVRLESLLGKRFRVGDVTFDGLSPDAPCRYLQELLGKQIQRPLLGRAGIRAAIQARGTVRIGQELEVLGPATGLLERPVVPLASGRMHFDFAQWAHANFSWWLEEVLRRGAVILAVVHDPEDACCVPAIRELDALHNELGAGVSVAVLSPRTMKENHAAAERLGVTVPLLHDVGSWTANDLGAFRDGRPRPALFVICPSRDMPLSWSADTFDGRPEPRILAQAATSTRG